MTEPRPGAYVHWKGAPYEVLGIARHSETDEPLVVCRQGYGDRSLWVRPVAMFTGRVQRDGYDGPASARSRATRPDCTSALRR